MPVDIHPGRRELTARRGDPASPGGLVTASLGLEDVWFRYSDDAWTLAGVDLEVPAGTSTAIVGETGSGKTTLGYLVARLYDAERGAIRIDGADVRDLSFASIAATVGVVSQ